MSALSAKLCPICGKPAEKAFRPFCSRRCADVDLHRWLADAYVLPAAETDADIADAEAAPRPSGQG
ncbi:MAG TPA: DNA gyrase inhibitor YacG [Xanthobacteraceae bacterium]|nr:DNA gyrase inhibitor YacG [Xanthobacteraceae bacterium]